MAQLEIKIRNHSALQCTSCPNSRQNPSHPVARGFRQIRQYPSLTPPPLHHWPEFRPDRNAIDQQQVDHRKYFCSNFPLFFYLKSGGSPTWPYLLDSISPRTLHSFVIYKIKITFSGTNEWLLNFYQFKSKNIQRRGLCDLKKKKRRKTSTLISDSFACRVTRREHYPLEIPGPRWLDVSLSPPASLA